MSTQANPLIIDDYQNTVRCMYALGESIFLKNML